MAEKNKTFTLQVQEEIATVWFDVAGEKMNTWTNTALNDFEKLLDSLEQRNNLKGVIFISGKPTNFHAGANLNFIAEQKDPDQLNRIIDDFHRLFLRLANIGIPSVAAINGPCLGGGYEFALAMTGRIATDRPSTIIGLPECTVGLFPGAGGTQRLPRLIGYPAIELILKGRTIPSAKALEIGMIDRVVPETEDLLEKAKEFLDEIIAGTAQLKRPQHDFTQLDTIIDLTHKEVLKANRGRELPAPKLALRAIREGLRTSLEEGLKIEKKYFVEVVFTPEAKGSINTFFLKTYTDKPEQMRPKGFQPKPMRKLAVLGFGAMGRGITIEILRRMQVPVVVKDHSEALEAGKVFVRKTLDDMAKRGQLKGSVDDLMDLIKPVTAWTNDFKDVDLVIEAVFEDPAVKAEVYQELCKVVADDCLIASNTSSVPITQLATNVRNPQRFGGTHFFSPVWRMELLEIIRGEKTSPDTVNNLLTFCAAIKKRPVICNDYPGFVVNAMLFPYFIKTFELLEDGVGIGIIDKAMTDFGLPVGPVKLVDEVGIDVLYSVLTKSLGLTPPRTLENVIRDGRLGRKKSGKGFFLADGTVDPGVIPLIPINNSPKNHTINDIQNLLYMPFVQVGKELLDKKIVDGPGSIDVGAIWGIGFPTEKGGPMKWADLTGLSNKLYGRNFYQ